MPLHFDVRGSDMTREEGGTIDGRDVALVTTRGRQTRNDGREKNGGGHDSEYGPNDVGPPAREERSLGSGS
jgi:hypothetical protein